MHLDGLMHAPGGLVTGLACGHAAGEVGRVRRVIPVGFLNNNQEPAHFLPSLRPLQTGLLEHAAQCAWSQIVSWMTCDRDAAGLGRVLELAVATSGNHQKPAVLFDEPEDFADLHRQGLVA